MSINNWPSAERPREKLISRGAHTLSDAELLAIFLRTGCPGKSAVDLARDLINHFGSLRCLLEANAEEFCQTRGLGKATYAQLQAVLEIARRHMEESLSSKPLLSSSEEVKRYLTARLRHKRQEVFAALFLDTQHQLIAFEVLFEGSLSSTAVYPREVIAKALEYNAASIIFAHNHPSGIAEPSLSDQALTNTLSKALALLDIQTLDHFIVGEGSIYSFAEYGRL